MNNFILAVFLLFTSASLAEAQTVPRFSDYAERVENVRTINVNLKSQKDARMFRTNLRNAAKKGVNFAGRYVLTGWGCGTNCSVWAIVDGRSGRVFFPPQFGGVGGGLCELPKNSLPADAPKQEEPEYPDVVVFKANSRLVVVNGFTGGDLEKETAKCGTYFYEWTGTRLRQVKFIAGKPSPVLQPR